MLILILGLVIGLTFALAACQDDGDDPATAEPTPGTVIPATATVEPTPTATATPTPSPSPTVPAVTPVETPTDGTDDDGETEAPDPTGLLTYTDDLYGYSLLIPEAWTGERPATGLRSVAAVFETDDESIMAQTLVLYQEEPTPPDDIVQDQISPLAGLSAFRIITEAPVSLDDGTEAYQVLYGYGTGSNEIRGSITFVTRGTVAVGIQVQAPRNAYERIFDTLEAVVTSLRIVPTEPFGVPRDESLILYLSDVPLTMDPGIATDFTSAQYIRQIFSGLVRLDDDLLPAPDLATWEVSEDETTYTFTLKDGAAFHDGTPVTMEDVVFSWQRALNANLPPVGGSGGSYLDDIVGALDYAAGSADSVSGLEVVDDNTLVVTIDEPKSYFLSKLTHTSVYVVKESNVPDVPEPRGEDTQQDDGSEQDEDETATEDAADDEEAMPEWWTTPIGTGPYRLAEYVPGRAVHLAAFDGYVGGPQSIENLVMLFHSGLPAAMVEEGIIDATTLIGAQTYASLQEEQSPLFDNITRAEQLSISYLGFNTAIAPFDDPDVRRAFLMAVDRESILEEHIGGAGRLAHGFMPPGLPGYDEEITAIPYDPERARALFNATAYAQMADSPPIVFVFAGADISPFHRAILEDWQQNLDVRIAYRAYGATYFYALPVILEAGANIYEYGWLADYPDPYNFLDTLFHTESEYNVGRAGSAEIDTLLEEARVAGEDRLDLYRQIERRMVDEAIAFPLVFGEDYVLVADHVTNLTLDSQGFLRLDGVTLEPRESEDGS